MIILDLKLGMRLYHPTLGQVKIVDLLSTWKVYPKEANVYVQVLTDEFTGNWTDFSGDSYYNQQGRSWWVPLDDFKNCFMGPPLSKHVIIQRRIKKLWNESKWVKKNPSQAY